jgi:SAM-dependent methyltransferase
VSRDELRAGFDRVAEQYDAVRPTYPPELIDEIAALGPRILEIGAGTGQATRALVDRGADVTAVELGANLAAVLARNVPEADVVVADFETWTPPQVAFDAVVAFTSFHWLEPATRYARATAPLRAGGALAVTEVAHVRVAGGDPFWDEVQADYDAVVPSPQNRPPPYPDDVADLSAEFEAAALVDVAVSRHRWDVEYTAGEWVAVLGTYSPHLSRDPDVEAELIRRIHARIAARGTVTKHYLATLTTGRTIVADRGA